MRTDPSQFHEVEPLDPYKDPEWFRALEVIARAVMICIGLALACAGATIAVIALCRIFL